MSTGMEGNTSGKGRKERDGLRWGGLTIYLAVNHSVDNILLEEARVEI